MKHTVSIERKPYGGETHELRQPVCTCGWKGQQWQGFASDYPGTEALTEANGHKLDVLLNLLQPETKPHLISHTYLCGCIKSLNLRTSVWRTLSYCVKHMPSFSAKPESKPEMQIGYVSYLLHCGCWWGVDLKTGAQERNPTLCVIGHKHPDPADDGPEVEIIRAIRATHEPDELVREQIIYSGFKMISLISLADRRWFKMFRDLYGPY